jgi:predicted Zn-dependent protease with MMP-like domain/Flp pilus assembly protein TadD
MRRSRAASLRLAGLLLVAAAACTARAPEPRSAEPARGRPGTAPDDAGQLERVRRPAGPCLPDHPGPEPAALVARAARLRSEGDPAAALACADEALEVAPRDRAPLRERALALAGLDRDVEARAAISRALAADPDDVATLHVAAELHVTRFGDRDSLEAGRDLALRGAALVLSGPAPGRSVARRLLLLAGMAENDLGHNRQALGHIDRVLSGDPSDLDALYERGVALYELCRFASARRAFEAVVRHAPGDAWSLHHLGLIAERAGDERRARELLGRAARLAPREIRAPVEMAPSAFDAELRRALAELPAEERAALDGVPVGVEELPALPDLVAVDPPLSPSILGLFRGPSLGEPCPEDEAGPCRSIVVYRRNLLRFARDRAQLAEQIRVTLLHELGHLHGESDEALRARGLE